MKLTLEDGEYDILSDHSYAGLKINWNKANLNGKFSFSLFGRVGDVILTNRRLIFVSGSNLDFIGAKIKYQYKIEDISSVECVDYRGGTHFVNVSVKTNSGF